MSLHRPLGGKPVIQHTAECTWVEKYPDGDSSCQCGALDGINWQTGYYTLPVDHTPGTFRRLHYNGGPEDPERMIVKTPFENLP